MDRNVRRAIEITLALPLARLAWRANRELLHALNVELANEMTIIVNDVDVVIPVNLNAMRSHNRAMQHRAQQVAVRIEHAQRISPTIEDIHVVLRVNRHRRSVAVERNAHRQLGPTRHRLKPSVSSNRCSRCHGR